MGKEPIYRLMEQALDDYGNNKYSEALDTLTQVITRAPKFKQAYLKRGIVYRQMLLGENTYEVSREAVSDFDKALEIDPKYAEAYNERGLAYEYDLIVDVSDPNFKKVEFDFTSAISLSPKFIDAWTNLGNLYRQVGKYTGAIRCYSRSIRLGAGVEILSFRAKCYSELRAHIKAISDYSEILAKTSECNSSKDNKRNFQEYSDLKFLTEAYFDRGHAFMLAGKYTDAIEDFVKLLQIHPTYYEVHYEIGLAYMNISEYKDAIVHLTETINWDSTYQSALYYRGLSHYYRGMEKAAYDDVIEAIGEAIKDFSKAIEMDPNNKELFYALAGAYRVNGDDESELEQLDKSLNIDNGYIDALLQRASIHNWGPESSKMFKGNDESIADLSKILMIDPYHKVALSFRAKAYLSKDDLDNAILDFVSLANLDPDYKWPEPVHYFGGSKPVPLRHGQTVSEKLALLWAQVEES